MRIFVRSLLAISFLVLGTRGSIAGETGSLVIIGGALRYGHAEVWSRIVRLAGGEGAKIAVLPTASGEPLKNGSRSVDALRAVGADAFLVPLYGDKESLARQAADSSLIAQVRSAAGVYFIGGSQERITAALGSSAGDRSPMLEAVWDVYRRGGVVAGTSAGAAVMSRMMFRQSRSVLNVLQEGLHTGTELVPGLGFLDPRWFVEQHCLVRGRFGRTLVAMRTLGIQYGLGVDEDTAVIVERGRALGVLGSKGAIVLDLSQATSDPATKAFNVRGARLTYLDDGDSYDLETLELTPSPQKLLGSIEPPSGAPVDKREVPVAADILGNTTVVEVMARLADGRHAEAIGLAFDAAAARAEPSVGFEFRFYRGADTRGWQSSTSGASAYTVSNIHLDVRPVEFSGPLYK
jgi:cyanophycinase